MEGIDKTLFGEFEKHVKSNDIIWDTNDISNRLKGFLELDADKYEKRQNLALDIASDILIPHQKQDLSRIATSLAQLERNLKDIEPPQRDHVCHALLTYLLGFFVISKLNKDDNFHFQWKLAGLLHDVGYPLEITDRIDEVFLNNYERDVLGEGPDFRPTGGKKLSKYLTLYKKGIRQKRNTLDLINKRLKNWEISPNPRMIFKKMIAGKKFDLGDKRTDHGIASAILVMKAIDKKYEQNNPKQTYDEDDLWNFLNMESQITNVCSAIYIHNLELDEHVWDFKKAPLATLLKVCDELQDWGRPLADNQKGELPRDYDIKYENGHFIFYAKNEKLNGIKGEFKNIVNFPIKFEKL